MNNTSEWQQLAYDANFVIKSRLSTLVDQSISWLQMYEPVEGYYSANSGGKDSAVVDALLQMAGVKYDSHYAITTVDPPELTKHIKKYYPYTERMKPKETMWELIPRKRMPPTRRVRYCCKILKEEGGQGRFCVTGVRWEESGARRKRKNVEYDVYGSKAKEAILQREEFYLMNDNDKKRRMIENCQIKGKHIINPIINWTEKDVWRFIHGTNTPYCELYDQGWKRIGCIGCPMAGVEGRLKEFERYPWYKEKYIKTFDVMLQHRIRDGLATTWKTGQEVFDWWIEK